MKARTFRITSYHELMLDSPPYNRANGLLIRMLLEAYFDGKLPSLRHKFMEELNKPRAKASRKESKYGII